MQSMLGTRIELRLNDPPTRRSTASSSPPSGPATRGAASPRTDLPGRSHPLPEFGGDNGGDATITAINDAWHGPGVPRVRMLPEMIALTQIRHEHPAARKIVIDRRNRPDAGVAGPVRFRSASAGLRRHRVREDRARPHDVDDLCPGYREGQVVFAIIDPKRQLLDAGPSKYLGGYAGTASAAQSLMESIAQELRRRTPPDDVSPQQLRDRSWWKGPEVVVVADDYDLAEGSGSPLRSLVPYLSQARDLGIHLVVLRRSGGASRASYEPVMQAVKEAGGAGLPLSGDRQEGQIWPKVWMDHRPPGCTATCCDQAPRQNASRWPTHHTPASTTARRHKRTSPCLPHTPTTDTKEHR